MSNIKSKENTISINSIFSVKNKEKFEAEINKILSNAHFQNIVIDMTNTKGIDLHALNSLILNKFKSESSNKIFSIEKLSPEVRDIIKFTKTCHLLGIR